MSHLAKLLVTLAGAVLLLAAGCSGREPPVKQIPVSKDRLPTAPPKK